MRAERVLCTSAVVCTVVLLAAPFTPRTTWSQASAASIRPSAAWDWAAALLAIVTIAGLFVGLKARPRVPAAVFGAAIAAVAIGAVCSLILLGASLRPREPPR
jgi:hypothetical protein